MPTVYAGGVRVSDLAPYLGDSTNWWPGVPQFSVRPLDSATRPEEERFVVKLQFVHNGSAENLVVEYRVWSSSALAGAIVTSEQQAVGSSLSGPSAGDQVLYFNQNAGFGAAPYVSTTVVRVGQIDVSIVWRRVGAYAGTSVEGGIAKKVVSRLKDALSGRISAPRPGAVDPHLLPPAGPEITQLGFDRLPVEVVPVMVGAAAPSDLASLFHRLGATDFVFGDYALNTDTHMEVTTAAFSFSSSTGSSQWLDQFFGAGALTQSGDYFNYDEPSGQYIAAFGVGSQGVLMFCRSAALGEAASRACESPMSRVANAWKLELGG